MTLITVSPRVDQELYERAKEAARQLGKPIQDAFKVGLESVIAEAEDPEREVARWGAIAEKILHIKGLDLAPARRGEVLEEILEILEKKR